MARCEEPLGIPNLPSFMLYWELMEDGNFLLTQKNRGDLYIRGQGCSCKEQQHGRDPRDEAHPWCSQDSLTLHRRQAVALGCSLSPQPRAAVQMQSSEEKGDIRQDESKERFPAC